MGVAGSGKSTVGRGAADQLGWGFVDADDHHPEENVDKMRRGVPLDDDDRWPWLDALRDIVERHVGKGESIVLACSVSTMSCSAISLISSFMICILMIP